MEIFEKASYGKLRFDSSHGQLSTEDLWDLSLQSLDAIAKTVNKRLRDNVEESFIPVKNVINNSTADELRLDILKHIINTKVAEAEKSKTRAEIQERIKRLKELAAQKADEQLSSKSMDEITQEIAQLEAAAQ